MASLCPSNCPSNRQRTWALSVLHGSDKVNRLGSAGSVIRPSPSMDRPRPSRARRVCWKYRGPKKLFLRIALLSSRDQEPRLCAARFHTLRLSGRAHGDGSLTFYPSSTGVKMGWRLSSLSKVNSRRCEKFQAHNLKVVGSNPTPATKF